MAGVRHQLGNSDLYARVNPWLEVPTKDERDQLHPGDLVQLLDESPESVAPFWVEISQVLGPGWYLGMAQAGEPVEFLADHVSGLERRPIQMGAWFDRGPSKEEPESPQSKGNPFDIFVPGREPRREPAPPPQPGSIFDFFKPKSGKGFGGFWKKKSKTTLEPIPPTERRSERGRGFHFPLLPNAPQRREEEFDEEFDEESDELDPAPPPMPVTPAGPEPEEGDDLFSILEEPGRTEEPPPAPRAPGGLIIAPEPPRPPQSPSGGLVPRGPAGLTRSDLPDDLFSVLEPERPQSPSGGLVPRGSREVSTGIPEDLFSVLEPETQTGGLSVPGSGSPFDILAPEESQTGLVVRPEGGVSQSIFDVLPAGVPPPQEEFRKEPPTEVREPERKPSRKKKPAGKWRMPSTAQWKNFFKETFDMPDLFKYLEHGRNDEYFVERQEQEEDTGEWPLIPIETFQGGEWTMLFHFFGIPGSVWEPYLDAISEEEANVGFMDVAWENFNTELLYPLSEALSKAFDELKPPTLPGTVVLSDDGDTNTYGLLYYERLREGELRKRRAQVRAAHEADQKTKKEWEKQKKAELKKIWGKVPSPEDLIPWIEHQFDVDAMFRDIQKRRKSKSWRDEMEDYGRAQMELETIAQIGPKRKKEYEYAIASFFGIPPQVVDVYEEAESDQEVWEDIFWPFFESLSEAFDMLLPSADLPGRILVDESQEADSLVIQYLEDERGN